MAITVEVAQGEPRPGSPVVVPITIQDMGAAGARVNIVRAIDLNERDILPANMVEPEDVNFVIERLLDCI